MYSNSPDNQKFKLPDINETKNEILIIKQICKKERDKGKKIVVVQGLGFVGAVMAAIISDTEINGKIPYFILGVDLNTEKSYWKIPIINSGLCPIRIEYPELKEIFIRVVKEKNNLRATWVKDSYSEADIVIIDINLDIVKLKKKDSNKFEVKMNTFKEAITDIGERINPECLIIIETTVPPGTIKKIVLPILEECFKARKIDIVKFPPLIAHSYERVMPGKQYIKSITNFWRSYSAVNSKAAQKVKKFLSTIIDIKNYPLTKLSDVNASELAKVLENSYRALNIAFIYEWTLFAEDIGINLFEVIDSIKVRKGTHDNIMYPGFGVGGYCLPKDPLLAQWASKSLFNRELNLNFSIEAVKVNDFMPHHTFDLLNKGLDGVLKDKKISILGASYKKDLDDTRNSPTITLYDKIKEAGGIPIVHDPYSNIIEGREDIKIMHNLGDALEESSAVVFVVNHKHYLNLQMEQLLLKVKENVCIVDAFNILSDEKIKFLKQNKCVVLGVGKGHIKNL